MSADEDTGDDDLTIRGEIDTTGVPELLKSLFSSSETGIVTFRNGDTAKSLYILNGRVVYAGSNNPDERLGESLLQRGKITARQYLEASKQIRPGLRLGAILVELQALESEDLIPAVEQQVKDIVLELFAWSHGDYELVIKDLDPESMMTVHISTENLILDGIRHTRAWSRVLRGIGDIGAVFAPTGKTEILYKLDLTEEEQETLSRVNGRSTVEQICEVSYLPNFETCRILWGFSVLGVIRRGHSGEAAAAEEGAAEHERELDLEEIVEKFNQMFSRIYTFLHGRLGGQADEFMDMALEEVSRQYATLFEGVDLKGAYGRADFEQLLTNVADLSPDQRKALIVTGLNELVFIIQLQVRTRQGPQEEAVISGIIKEGLRKLGAA